jgi:hypothetical protein
MSDLILRPQAVEFLWMRSANKRWQTHPMEPPVTPLDWDETASYGRHLIEIADHAGVAYTETDNPEPDWHDLIDLIAQLEVKLAEAGWRIEAEGVAMEPPMDAREHLKMLAGAIVPEVGMTVERSDGEKLRVIELMAERRIKCQKWKRRQVVHGTHTFSLLKPIGTWIMTRELWDAWVRGDDARTAQLPQEGSTDA